MSKRPIRTCIGCRKPADPRDLVRLVRDRAEPDVVRPDPERTAAGRGAYVHPSESCVAAAIARRAFNRAYRTAPGPSGWRLDDVVEYVQEHDGSTPTADRPAARNDTKAGHRP